MVKLSSSFSIILPLYGNFAKSLISFQFNFLILTMKFTLLIFMVTLVLKCRSIPMGANVKQHINHEKIHPEFRNNPHVQRNRPEELTTNFWFNNGKDFVSKQLHQSRSSTRAKNIILFIGDGMSLTTQTAARMYKGGEEKSLSFEEFPYAGAIKTYCLDYQVADSACAATAYLSGVKNNYGMIGISGKVRRSDCVGQMDDTSHIKSIAKWAIDAGKSAGLVTTTRVTDASPGTLSRN